MAASLALPEAQLPYVKQLISTMQMYLPANLTVNRVLKYAFINVLFYTILPMPVASPGGILSKKEMGNIIFSIIWLLVLIFIAFWLAAFAAGFYIILLPFTVCIEALSGLTDFLLSLVQFPRYCAQAMVEGRGFN